MVLRGMLLKKAILFLESHLIEIGTQSIFCVDAPEALFLLTESKYIQSDIGDSYMRVKHFLEADKKVLFCGIPCQTQGLRWYLNKEFDSLYIIDFICHGVASRNVWEEYLKEISFKDGM